MPTYNPESQTNQSHTTEGRTKQSAGEVLSNKQKESRPPVGRGEQRPGTMPLIILMNVFMIIAVIAAVVFATTGQKPRVEADQKYAEQPPASWSARQFGPRDASRQSDVVEMNQHSSGETSSNSPRTQDPINEQGASNSAQSPAEQVVQ